MTMPAVLTIQSGINKLRYATLIGIKQAKMKPLRKVTWAEVEGKLSKHVQKIEKLYVPGSRRRRGRSRLRRARRRNRWWSI